MTPDPPASPVAIITGAGTGIGLATARRLHAAGYALILASRNAEALDRAAAELREQGKPPVACMATDVSKYADVKRLVQAAHQRFARLDVLINNAGLARVIPIGQNTEADIRTIHSTNALGPAYAITLAWPLFESQGGGCIINVSTIGTADPFPGFFAYAAAKSAVNSMVRSCAKEGARIGVRAFSIAPGAVETGMLRGLFSDQVLPPAACLHPDEVARIIADCIMGRRDADNGRTIFIQRGKAGRIDERVE